MSVMRSSLSTTTRPTTPSLSSTALSLEAVPTFATSSKAGKACRTLATRQSWKPALPSSRLPTMTCRLRRTGSAPIKRTVRESHRGGSIGGKVLPRWASTPPMWLTRDHWSPLAAQDDLGDVPFSSSDRQVCLVGANLVIRKDLLEQFGGFRPDVQRVQDSVGSIEDRELQIRLWKAGLHGLYVPDLVVMSDVSANRLTKKYHRRWHRGHGHFYAMARLEESEPIASAGCSAYQVTSTNAWSSKLSGGLAVWRGAICTVRLRTETDLWFSAGFIGTRYREFATAGDRSHWAELSRFVKAVARRLITASGILRRPAFNRRPAASLSRMILAVSASPSNCTWPRTSRKIRPNEVSAAAGR